MPARPTSSSPSTATARPRRSRSPSRATTPASSTWRGARPASAACLEVPGEAESAPASGGVPAGRARVRRGAAEGPRRAGGRRGPRPDRLAGSEAKAMARWSTPDLPTGSEWRTRREPRPRRRRGGLGLGEVARLDAKGFMTPAGLLSRSPPGAGHGPAARWASTTRADRGSSSPPAPERPAGGTGRRGTGAAAGASEGGHGEGPAGGRRWRTLPSSGDPCGIPAASIGWPVLPFGSWIPRRACSTASGGPVPPPRWATPDPVQERGAADPTSVNGVFALQRTQGYRRRPALDLGPGQRLALLPPGSRLGRRGRT